MALARIFKRFMDAAAPRYQAALGDKLGDLGLRYEDLYDPLLDLDVAEAIRRLPEDEVLARNARLKRALDLSMKHEVLHGELREKQTPFLPYMKVVLDEVKNEKLERMRLGAVAPYMRTIP